MRVLLTGGSGFVGSHVADQLCGLGHTVRALVRASSDTRVLEGRPGLELATGAVEDPASLGEAVKGCDAVIHVAGLIKARRLKEFFEVNAEGTKNLLEATVAAGSVRRFVQVSSLAAVGPSVDGSPVDEGTTPRPVNEYGRSKLAGEVAVLGAADKIPVTVIRPPLVYGPRDRETLSFFRAIKRGSLPIVGDGSNTLSVLYVTDCAAAIVAAALSDGPSGRTYFVEDGAVYVWREALEDIEKAMGKQVRLRAGMPFWMLRLAAAANQARRRVTNTAQMLTLDKVRELEQRHRVCSGAAARRDLQWAPQIQWTAGVTLAAEWYRTQKWL
ncbi:MAG: NAD(P)-dependent oxidoreductase [Marmoricola sp.]